MGEANYKQPSNLKLTLTANYKFSYIHKIQIANEIYYKYMNVIMTQSFYLFNKIIFIYIIDNL